MIDHKTIIIVAIVCLGCMIWSATEAQSRVFNKKVHAQNMADSLKTTGLIFIIASRQKKIQALDSLWRYDGDSSWLMEKINTQQSVEEETAMWRKAFDENYHFSPIRFISDTTLLPTNQRKRGYFIRLGQLESRAEALIISNQRFESLARPFPYFSRLEPFMAWFGGKSRVEMATKAVERLQDRLDKFSP